MELRRKVLTERQVQYLRQLAADKTNSVEEVYKTFGIGRTTFYRYVNANQEERFTRYQTSVES